MQELIPVLDHLPFASIMEKSQSWFKLFTYSGVVVFIGLLIMIYVAIAVLRARPDLTGQ